MAIVLQWAITCYLSEPNLNWVISYHTSGSFEDEPSADTNLNTGYNTNKWSLSSSFPVQLDDAILKGIFDSGTIKYIVLKSSVSTIDLDLNYSWQIIKCRTCSDAYDMLIEGYPKYSLYLLPNKDY